MTERQWDEFFGLLACIADLPGSDEEKVGAVKTAAGERGEAAVGPFEWFTVQDWE